MLDEIEVEIADVDLVSTVPELPGKQADAVGRLLDGPLGWKQEGDLRGRSPSAADGRARGAEALADEGRQLADDRQHLLPSQVEDGADQGLLPRQALFRLLSGGNAEVEARELQLELLFATHEREEQG